MTDTTASQQQQIKVEDATQEQKLTAMVKYLDGMSNQMKEQNKLLRSLNSYLTFFAILIIIGLVVQGCTAIMSM